MNIVTIMLLWFLNILTLIQQITAFYEDNFPEVMKNILVIKGAFLIFLKLLFSAIFDQHFINYLNGQNIIFPNWLAEERQNFNPWKKEVL